MLTIYGVYRSRASRPLWLLGEIGLPFRHIPVIQAYRLADPSSMDAPLNTASPSYLAVNPAGQIPAMDDEGFILTESMAITHYLANRHGGDLGPADAKEEALMVQASLIAATSIEMPSLTILLAQSEGRAATPEGAAEVAAAADRLRRPFARLNAVLAKQDWLVGGRFTVADINVAECSRYAQASPDLIDEFPAVKAWLARCQARPAFKAMWERRLTEPA